MSKIQTIQPNYQRGAVSKRGVIINNSPAFAGGLDSISKDAMKIFEDGCKPVPSKFRKTFNKACTFLNDHDSEIQNQVINAIFTTTLAPIMIAWNPFSKSDEKTKKYTALRQPISAGIAITGGYLMTKSLDDYLNYIHSEGFNPSLDLRMNPDKHYLEAKFKKAYKEATDKVKFLDDLKADKEAFTTKYEANGQPTKAYLKACKKAYPKVIQEQRQKLFTTLISEDPANLSIDEGNVIKLNGKEIGKNIPKMATNAELNQYLDGNNLHKMKLSKFLTNQFKFEFYDGGEIQPQSIGKKLSEIKALDFLKALGIIDNNKIGENELKKFAMEFRQSKPNNLGELNNIFSNGVLKTDGAKNLLGTIGKDTSRNIEMSIGEEIGKASTLTMGQFLHQLGYKLNDGSLQKLMDKDVYSVLTELSKEKLKNLSIEVEESINGKTVRKLVKILEDKHVSDFAKNIIKNNSGKIAKNFGNFKKYAGIGFNLPMTAITCTILNWAYPRIVEKLFPSLVKDDAKKGGNK